MKKLLLLIAIIFWGAIAHSQCTTPMSFSITTTQASCSTCCDGSAQITNFTGGCPPFNISWSNGAQGFLVTNLCADSSYTVTVYDGGCCPALAIGCTIPNPTPTGTYNYVNTNALIIYPNPTESTLNLESNLQGAEFRITDILGKEIKKIKIENKKTSIDISDLENGIYFIRTKNSIKKFIVLR